MIVSPKLAQTAMDFVSRKVYTKPPPPKQQRPHVQSLTFSPKRPLTASRGYQLRQSFLQTSQDS